VRTGLLPGLNPSLRPALPLQHEAPLNGSGFATATWFAETSSLGMVPRPGLLPGGLKCRGQIV